VKLRIGEWRSEIPATLQAVEEFCVEFKSWIAGACVGIKSFPAELVLREALTNSVIHGGMEDPRQRISCILRAKRDRLLIAVQDQGEGFDWHAARDRESDFSNPHGRGIQVIRMYASSVRFNSKGNAVLLVQRF
jgi:anti-sigma regulatory factor (Ser/Thr protein kinase)